MERAITITEHAVERYIERVRPALDRHQARIELERLVQSAGEIVPERPEWCLGASGDGDAYLVVGNSFALPLVRDSAVTLLIPGTVSPGARRARKKARQARQVRSQVKNHSQRTGVARRARKEETRRALRADRSYALDS